MKLKNLFLISMLFVFVAALTLNANAEISCNLTSPTILGNFSVLNATFNVSTDASTGNVSAFFEGRSVSTANSSFSFIGNVTNTSNLRHVNFTLPTSVILEEANDWEFRTTCYLNASSSTITPSENVATSSAITGRTLDRGGIPAIPTSIMPIGTQSNNTLDIVSTITGIDTTGCTLEFIGQIPNGAVLRNAMTHSGNLCTARYTSVSDSTYQYRITATDGLNLTTTVSQFITVGSDEPNLQALGALKQVEIQQQQQQKKSSNNLFFLIIAVVVVAILANKKGGR